MAIFIACAMWAFEVMAACSGSGLTWASTPDRASVAACVNSAPNGATIEVSSGSASWSSNVPIQGKALTIIGSGQGATIISSNAFTLTNSASRISAFTFNLGSGGGMFIVEASTGWRIDHNTITRTTYGDWLNTYGQGQFPSEGLIDNNTINLGRIVHYGEDSSTAGRHIWSRPLDLGSSHAVYVEDNVINFPDGSAGGSYLNVLDGNWGCRYVARFNTITGGRFEAHSVQGDNTRACMLWEIYNNTLTNPAIPNYRPWLLRGGTGMVFHNTTDGRFVVNEIDIDNIRSHQNDVSNQVPVWRFCDGTSFVDGNTGGGEGYPCRDQIGRSTDSSLWNYSSPAPAQGLAPAYLWRNTQLGLEIPTSLNCVGTSTQCTRQSTKHIVESRDYYTFRGSFTGANGVGEGPLAARPTSCTPGVGYWATDQGEWNSKQAGTDGQLYKCTAPNTWTLYYKPYPYPHPLATGQPEGPPPAPSNLRVQ